MTLGPSRVVRLLFDAPAPAAWFHRALQAENVDAVLNEIEVGLRIAPWYTLEDAEAIALAVTKVAHYLGIRG